MELIERYLQAVKFALPVAQQDDIVKELRENILSQVEEKESELGRSLTEDDQVDLLKKLGNPSHLASRYRTQHHLIGASLFPVYWKVLKWALGLALLVHIVGSIALAAAGKPLTQSLGVLWHFPGVAIVVFAWITIAFFAMEFFGAKLCMTDRFDPRQLPPLVKTSPRKSRIELIAQLLIQSIFGVWWLTGLHYQHFIFGPGVNFLNFAPIWLELFPLFVIMLVVDISFTVTMLVRPQWTDGARLSKMVMSALGLVLLFVLIRTPELFVAANSSAGSLTLAATVNQATHLGLLVAVIVNIINIGVATVRLIGDKVNNARNVVA